MTPPRKLGRGDDRGGGAFLDTARRLVSSAAAVLRPYTGSVALPGGLSPRLATVLIPPAFSEKRQVTIRR